MYFVYKRRLFFYSSRHLMIIFGFLFIQYFCQRFHNSKIANIFVTRVFYYEQFKILGKMHPRSLIMLFNTEKRVDIDVLRKGSACITYSEYGWPYWRKAEIEGIIGEKTDFECKISVYRLFCQNLILNSNKELNQQKLIIKLSKQPNQFRLTLKEADNVRRKFVVCPSRLFAFDQWHLFITTMELYRTHRVDLVSVYIQSVNKDVFQLIKAYVHSGFIQLRPSLEMPVVDTLEFNPNSETSWQNQLTNFQDCLYEFRESAEFLAFPDWDDFMFTRNYKIPYHAILQKMAISNPKIVGFFIDRYMGVHESLDEMNAKDHNIVDFWRIGIQYSKRNLQVFNDQFYGKAIYRPNNGLMGVDLHWANRVESNDYLQVRVSMKDLYIIHARDYSKYPMNGYIRHTDELERNFNEFSEKNNLTGLLQNLPKREVLVKSLNNCLGFNSQGMGKLVAKSKSKCWNYHKCGIRSVRSNCVNVKNHWRQIDFLSGKIIVYLLDGSEFVEENVCTY